MTLIGALYARWFFFSLNRVFRQERFKRFLWLSASLIRNGATLRKCYIFSCRCKNVLYRQIFVKVDAQIEEECQDCQRTISYLQGYSCPTLYCTANTVRNTRKTTLC